MPDAFPPPPVNPVPSPEVTGQWSGVFSLRNVAIHTSVLPTGKVLMWGRRDSPDDSLDVQVCTPFVWNPQNGEMFDTPQPTFPNGSTINLFCAGHAFLPNGHLLVAGGHHLDSDGINQSCFYDPFENTWTPSGKMNERRWYPTLVTLANGSVLVSSGSYFVTKNGTVTANNNVQQIWENGKWRDIVTFDGLPLYPRLHMVGDGRVLMSGTNATSFLLDTRDNGSWTPPLTERKSGQRDYAPAVQYDVNKVIYIGGGHNRDSPKPTNAAERIDVSQNPLVWEEAGKMNFARRQHNAVLLPDGTVLVTGGTQGGGGFSEEPGFNDLTPGMPVHEAELWNPATNTWMVLAAESVDRCYHSTAVLLLDATVLSAGGGEYVPFKGGGPNDLKDSHRDGQIFRPPYLFRGERPVITSAPDAVRYGEPFVVQTPNPEGIKQVTWIRLPTVTHSLDMSQRINFLVSSPVAQGVRVTTPTRPEDCPPGHYMLFLLNENGVPSEAKIVRIDLTPVIPAPAETLANVVALNAPTLNALAPIPTRVFVPLTMLDRDKQVRESATGMQVVVGLTPSCPYGLGACWGGAYEALERLQDVASVQQVPDTQNSLAFVNLTHSGLPPVASWPEQFARTANGTYGFRGIEVTLQGTVTKQGNQLTLEGTEHRPPVVLIALEPEAKIQWDHGTLKRRALTRSEADAYNRLTKQVRASTNVAKGTYVTVTGPLQQTEHYYYLQLRTYRLSSDTLST